MTFGWDSSEREALSIDVLYQGRGSLWLDSLTWTSAALDWAAL